MRNLMLGAAALALLATAAAPAAAAPAPARPLVKATALKTLRAFRAADADRSRSLSSDEFAAAGGQDSGFDALDVNNDGSIGYFELLRGVFLRLKARINAGG